MYAAYSQMLSLSYMLLFMHTDAQMKCVSKLMDAWRTGRRECMEIMGDKIKRTLKLRYSRCEKAITARGGIQKGTGVSVKL